MKFQISFFSHSFVKSSSDSVPAEMIRILFLLFWSVGMNFVICEFCEMVTDHFEAFDYELCQCNWYSFPIEIQRILIIVIANTQQPEILQAFGNTPCTREVFKKVTHFYGKN